MIDAAVEALGTLMRERRWGAPQVAQAAASSGIVVSEDTVLRVSKRERKPSLEFGIWLLRQVSSDSRFPLRSTAYEAQPLSSTVPPQAAPPSWAGRNPGPVPPAFSKAPEARSESPVQSQPEAILRQIRHTASRPGDAGGAELVPLLKQLLERLTAQEAAAAAAAPPPDPAAQREAVLRRVEEELVKDVDDAAAAKLELGELKKYRPKLQLGGGRGRAAGEGLSQAAQDELRKEIRSLAHSGLACAQSEDIAGLRRSVHALIECAPHCRGEVLEAEYEFRLCQLSFVLIDYRFQEGSFDKVYQHFRAIQELMNHIKRGPLGLELADYSELRLDLIVYLSETKWRDGSTARDILLSPEEIAKLWKINENRLRPRANSADGNARIHWEMRLGQAGVSVLKLALRYADRQFTSGLLEWLNRQSSLGLDLEPASDSTQRPESGDSPHRLLLRTEWEIGKLFTFDCLLRESQGGLSRTELERLQRRRIQLSAELPYDPASYQRGIDLEYKWMLAHMARASLRVAQ